MTYVVQTLTGPVDAAVRPPGSKSETIRALAAAALADGRSHLYGALEAEDPKAMVGALRALGVTIDDRSDPWSVDGSGGRLAAPSIPVDVNESGLSARIVIALAGSLDGVTHITGRGRLPERPMGGIVTALRGQGVEVSGDRIPLEISGRGHLWGGRVEVDCTESSQFATALMLVAPIMHENCVLELKGLASSAGYLEGTVSIMRRFGATISPTVTGYEIENTGYRATDLVIEPDVSAAVYPLAVAAITGGRVEVEGLGQKTWQPDIEIVRCLEAMGCRVTREHDRLVVDARRVTLKPIEVDLSAAPDGALALAVVCLFASGPSTITGLGSLRHKESDRLAAIGSGISAIGGRAVVDGETLQVLPSDLHAGTIDPHGDHRIAMALATAGTKVPGVAIADPDVVNKTWPEFWDVLGSLSVG